MNYLNVVKTFFVMGFKEYFLARRTALMQLVVLPVLAPVLLMAFVIFMTSIMVNNVKIEDDNEQVDQLSSVIGIVFIEGNSEYFDVVSTGLKSLTISNRTTLFANVDDADNALIQEKAHAVLVITSLSPLSIEIRSHSQKQTVYHHVLEALDSYNLAEAMLPLRQQLVQERTGLSVTEISGMFSAGELSKVKIGKRETPLFALVIVGLFWVGTVMYPVSIAKMNIFYNNDITGDDLSHCLSLKLPSVYYVLSRLAGAYAVYLPASLIMCGIITAYMAMIRLFMLSPLAAPFYASDEIRVVIEQYLSWSEALFSSQIFILPLLIITLGIPMLAINLLIYFYSKDEKAAVTYSSYLDSISYAFPAFAAFVSSTIPDVFGALPLLQQYYFLRAVVVDTLTAEFLLMYIVSGLIFLALLILIGSYRAYHPKRWVRT